MAELLQLKIGSFIYYFIPNLRNTFLVQYHNIYIVVVFKINTIQPTRPLGLMVLMDWCLYRKYMSGKCSRKCTEKIFYRIITMICIYIMLLKRLIYDDQ